ncbi:tetratricopeptide repeat protein [Flavihumibacter petaseus]|uniref:Tetratricopeptide repeat protein n=1 Tax=Flavihumibacter petaseus NBRC 106054 TaxID=1220578 RepID=A0A0E9N0H6_9BACT|nr:tetratricopeptide repeat protein [Flavihumibacter petaseus]GAO43283.1 hypothetical protein FPE01S_02_03880 [Flavihumibacter petaseus NBRC 106054]
MTKRQGNRYIVCLIFCLTCFFTGWGQPTLDPDLKKPAKYENRTLRAEKTGEKRFTVTRRFFQNTYTHYNYAFNAEAKLEKVVNDAKAQHIDRYTELLPFYNYSLEATSTQKIELDSVIYKVNAGILLHDLRSNWMDNLYLLMGQAYYYRNQLDSAYMTFHYMNYAFAPKDADGYDLYIASNANEGGNAMQVSTEEKRNLPQRVFSEPPSRNDGLIWLIRTYITQGNMAAAGTLIQTLQHDPTFPNRLQPALAEVTAYYFYNRPQYDSAAWYLEKALPQAADKNELSRWEYLLGQLYGLSGNRAAAKDAFARAIKHTLNPVLEVAAQLQSTQQFDNINEVDWQAAVAALEKMAKKERYTNYRDLIYYTIARIDLRREKLPEAQGHLLKSVKYSFNNPEQKTKSYLMLGDLAFEQQQYLNAKMFYDSVETNQLPEADGQNLENRKAVLGLVTEQLYVLQRQDSLQRLAAMPEADRTAFLKKQLKALRKQQGLKEEESLPQVGGPVLLPNASSVPTDLFNTFNAGEWYFYNNSLKSRGFTEFRQKWGNRPNTDNWRRSSSASNLEPAQQVPEAGVTGQEAEGGNELSLEKLLAPIPLTPEQMQVSNDSIRRAQFLLGMTLQQKLEDYAGAAKAYETILEKFPNNENEAEILYNLYICYQYLGKTDQMAQLKAKLLKDFPDSRQAHLAVDPKAVQESDSTQVRQATARYEEIYNMFLSGQFTEAVDAKRAADSVFGVHHWTPQLLYIESIYYMKVRQDSLAIQTLGQLATQFPDHPLAERATNLISVLSRRAEIEQYLNNLQIERPAEDSVALPVEEPVKVEEQKAVPPVVPEPVIREPEAKAGKVPGIVKDLPVSDSTRLKKEAPKPPAGTQFSRHAQQPHFVSIILEDVDPVYVNETRNAFDRYNKEKYYNTPMNVTVVSLNDKVKMVAIKGLANEQAAVDYIKKAKEIANREIIPWLKADKYYFIPVAEDNMDLLMSSKDLPGYRKFLQQLFPDL